MNKGALFLILASLAAGQTEPRQSTYEFKNVNIERAMEIVNFVRQLEPRVLIEVNGPFKTAILQGNGNVPPEAVEKAVACSNVTM